MYKYLLLFLLAVFSPLYLFSQETNTDSSRLEIILPEGEDWKHVDEGETINVQLSARGGTDSNYTFLLRSDHEQNMMMDVRGNFWWPIDYEFVDEADSPLSVPVFFYVSNQSGEKDSVEVILRVSNKTLEPIARGEMKIDFSQKVGWNLLNEGDTLEFQVRTLVGDEYLDSVRYFLEGDEGAGIEMDSLGFFRWIPSYDLVDRLEETRDKHIVFIAEDGKGNTTSEKVVFTVFHKNRPPVIRDLPIFYVVQGTNNVFQLPAERVTDFDDDPVVVIPDPSKMPQGAVLSSKGRLTWKPSRLQFNQLLEEPVRIYFSVEDQPYKARTSGILQIEASKLDLPPEITAIPNDSIFEIREDQFVNINFYLGDPNGDKDVATFNFVSDTPDIPKEALIQNTSTQYEFVWEPGYDFVADPDLFRDVTIRFFAFDQSRNTTERIIRIRVEETRNMIKFDNDNYGRYKDILVRSLDLIEQLDENQKELEKKLKKAKKGKKTRALVSASFGAITGLSPLILQDEPQKIVSGVGGTTVMTMGTLEARDAVGESIDEVGNLIKTNVQLRNKLQNEGDGFARRYNSKASRRNESFSFDLDKLKSILNDHEIVKLELDPNWENPKEITDRRLKQNFTDYKPQATN